jgi:hypothetical protein
LSRGAGVYPHDARRQNHQPRGQSMCHHPTPQSHLAEYIGGAIIGHSVLS